MGVGAPPIDQQEIAEAMGFADMGEALYYLCSLERGEWSQEAVADLIGVSRHTIRLWMLQWGIAPRGRGLGRSHGKNEPYWRSLRRLGRGYVSKKSAREVAQRLGCTRKTVSHYVNLWGWKTKGRINSFFAKSKGGIT